MILNILFFNKISHYFDISLIKYLSIYFTKGLQIFGYKQYLIKTFSFFYKFYMRLLSLFSVKFYYLGFTQYYELFESSSIYKIFFSMFFRILLAMIGIIIFSSNIFAMIISLLIYSLLFYFLLIRIKNYRFTENILGR